MENLPVLVLLPKKYSLKDTDKLREAAGEILTQYMDITLNVPREKLKVRPLSDRELVPFKEDYQANYEGDVSWDQFMLDEGYVQAEGTTPPVYGYLVNPKATFTKYEVGGRFQNSIPVLKGLRSPWITKVDPLDPMARGHLRLNQLDWAYLFGDTSKMPTFATAAKIRQIDFDASKLVAEKWLSFVYETVCRTIGTQLGSTSADIGASLAKIHEESLYGFFEFDHLRDMMLYPDEKGKLAVSFGKQEFMDVYKNLFSFAPFALCTTDEVYQPAWLDYYGLLAWNARFKELIDKFDPEDILVMCECISKRNTTKTFFFHQCLVRPSNLQFLPLGGDELKDNYGGAKKDKKL